MWVDTHCHLDAAEFNADRDAVYARAVTAGMASCIIPSVSWENCSEVLACCQRYEKCVPAYGIHPLFADRATPKHLDQLSDWLRTQPAVAVGEIGLDGSVAGLEGKHWIIQQFYFTEQLKLARQFDLPVILHVRKSIDAVIQGLRQFPVKGGIAHAFNGSRQQADILISMGFVLGFGGAMTYPGSTRIRQLATELPLSAIVLETDAPDLPPVWLRQGPHLIRNEPVQIPAIAAVLADLRRVPVDEVLQICAHDALPMIRRM
jgi:TatD DNase family protein